MKPKQLTLPMMPLNLVLLPEETTKLYIFEQRYRQMVAECVKNNASFGIPYNEKGVIGRRGCEVKVLRVLKHYSNGAMDILVECVGLFSLLEFTEQLRPKLYGAGEVRFITDEPKVELPDLQDAVVNYFSCVQNKMLDYDTVRRLSVYSVASALQLTPAEKYRLISSYDPQRHLFNLLHFIIYVIEAEQDLKERFIEN